MSLLGYISLWACVHAYMNACLSEEAAVNCGWFSGKKDAGQLNGRVDQVYKKVMSGDQMERGSITVCWVGAGRFSMEI